MARLVLLVFCFITLSCADPAGYFVTLSGLVGTPPFPYSDNPANWDLPNGIVYDPATGYLWVADTGHHNIRRISKDGTVITIGTGPGPSSIDGVGAANVRFISPTGIALDSKTGLLYISQQSHIIRRLDPSNFNVSTIAGVEGVAGAIDSAHGLSARFNFPAGIIVNSLNDLLIVADSNNHAIRTVSLGSGAVATLTGFTYTAGSNDGAANVATFNTPLDVSIDAAGNIYVADSLNNRVRSIISGFVQTYLGSTPGNEVGLTPKFYYVQAIPIVGNTMYIMDTYGILKSADLTSKNVSAIFTRQTQSTIDGPFTSAAVYNPKDISVDPVSGFIYMADTGNNLIRTAYTNPPPQVTALSASQVTATSITVSWLFPTFAHTANFSLELDNNTGSFATVYQGVSLTFKAVGLTPLTSYRFRITAMNDLGSGPVSSVLTVLTTAPGIPAALAAPFVIDTVNHVSATSIPLLWSASDDNGSKILSYRVEYQLGPHRSGSWSTYGTTESALNLTISGLQPLSPYMFRVYATNSIGESDPSPTFYISTAGYSCTQPLNANVPTGYYFALYLNQIVYNSLNNTILVADINRIREIDVLGNVVASFGSGATGSLDGPGAFAHMNVPNGIFVDTKTGIYYFTDKQNCQIRMIQNGMVSTIVGNASECPGPSRDGNRTYARFNYPSALTIGGDGYLYVMDQAAYVLRKVNLISGDVITVAGSTTQQAKEIDGQGLYSVFGNVLDIITNTDGNILIASEFGNSIRQYNITSGEVTTIVGNASIYHNVRNDGQGLAAGLMNPVGMTIDATTGDVYFMDVGSATMRKVDIDRHVTTIAGGHNTGFSDGESLTAFFIQSIYYFTLAQRGVFYAVDIGNSALRTIYGIAPTAPAYLTLNTLTATSVVATWKPSVFACMVDYYTLQMNSGSGFVTAYNGTDHSAAINGLPAGSTGIQIRVSATNRYGTSDWSATYIFSTPSAGVPTAPTPVISSVWSVNSVNITWTAPLDNGSPITSYTLLMDDGKGSGFQTIYQGSGFAYSVSNLSPLTLYRFQMYSTNAKGNSQSSNIVEFQTTALVQNIQIPGVPFNGSLQGIAFDSENNIWFSKAQQLFRVTPLGDAHVIGAKSGIVDGDESVARFYQIMDLAYDSSTNTIVVADSIGGIRRVTPSGTAPNVSFNVSTIMSGLQYASVTVDNAGTIYAGNVGSPYSISKWQNGVYTPNYIGGDINHEATDFGNFSGVASPLGLVVDPSNQNLYSVNSQSYNIKQARFNDSFNQVLTGQLQPKGVSRDGPASITTFASPVSLTIDPSGRTIFVTDAGCIRAICLLTRTTQTIASNNIGADVFGNKPLVSLVSQITFDAYGFLWVIDNIQYQSINNILLFVSKAIPVPPLPPVFSNSSNSASVTLKAGSLHPVTLWSIYVVSEIGDTLFYAGTNSTITIPVTSGSGINTYQFKACAYNLYGGLCSDSVRVTTDLVYVPITSATITTTTTTTTTATTTVSSSSTTSTSSSTTSPSSGSSTSPSPSPSPTSSSSHGSTSTSTLASTTSKPTSKPTTTTSEPTNSPTISSSSTTGIPQHSNAMPLRMPSIVFAALCVFVLAL